MGRTGTGNRCFPLIPEFLVAIRRYKEPTTFLASSPLASPLER